MTLPHIGHAYTTIISDTLAMDLTACKTKRPTLWLVQTSMVKRSEQTARARGKTPKSTLMRSVSDLRSLWDEFEILAIYTGQLMKSTSKPCKMSLKKMQNKRRYLQEAKYEGFYLRWLQDLYQRDHIEGQPRCQTAACQTSSLVKEEELLFKLQIWDALLKWV